MVKNSKRDWTGNFQLLDGFIYGALDILCQTKLKKKIKY